MQIDDVEALTRTIGSGWPPEFLLSWGHTANDQKIGKHVLTFGGLQSVDRLTYASAEHYMMARKAERFGDKETLAAKPGRVRGVTLKR